MTKKKGLLGLLPLVAGLALLACSMPHREYAASECVLQIPTEPPSVYGLVAKGPPLDGRWEMRNTKNSDALPITLRCASKASARQRPQAVKSEQP